MGAVRHGGVPSRPYDALRRVPVVSAEVPASCSRNLADRQPLRARSEAGGRLHSRLLDTAAYSGLRVAPGAATDREVRLAPGGVAYRPRRHPGRHGAASDGRFPAGPALSRMDGTVRSLNPAPRSPQPSARIRPDLDVRDGSLYQGSAGGAPI